MGVSGGPNGNFHQRHTRSSGRPVRLCVTITRGTEDDECFEVSCLGTPRWRLTPVALLPLRGDEEFLRRRIVLHAQHIRLAAYVTIFDITLETSRRLIDRGGIPFSAGRALKAGFHRCSQATSACVHGDLSATDRWLPNGRQRAPNLPQSRSPPSHIRSQSMRFSFKLGNIARIFALRQR